MIQIEPKLVYLACPYSDPDPTVRQARFEHANRIAASLMKESILIFSPISHTHPIAVAGDLPKGWDFWEQYDRAYLEICRAMVVMCLPGWKESKGVQAETEIMKKLSTPWFPRPIFYYKETDQERSENLAAIIGLLKRVEALKCPERGCRCAANRR